MNFTDALAHWTIQSLHLKGLDSSPAFRERIEILITNSFSLAIFCLLVAGVYFLFPRTRIALYRWLFSCLSIATFIIRATLDYAYDTPLGFLALSTDIASICYVSYRLGRLAFRKLAPWEQLLGGLGLAVLSSFAMVTLGVSGIFSSPFFAGHGLWTAILLLLLWTDKQFQLPNIEQKLRAPFSFLGLFAFLVFLLPLLPYLGTAGPPDADSTTIGELVGYLFQGRNFQHATTGVPGEWISIRYPAGLPSVAWLFGYLLNVQASESLLLLWILGWLLFIVASVFLAKRIKANPIVALLFLFTTTVTGAFGLAGGQIQEMLTYSLGMLMIGCVIDRKWILAGTSLAGGLLLQTTVALPFGLVFLLVGIKELFNTPKWVSLLSGGLVVALATTYCLLLSIEQGALYPTYISTMIQRLTIPQFLENVGVWLVRDTHSLFFLGLPLCLAGFLKTWRHEWAEISLVFLIWFFGGNLINGLLGDNKSMGFPSTFQEGFSVVGPWFLGIAWLFSRTCEWLNLGTLLRGFLLAIVSLLWFFFCFPGFYFQPVSVFVTHADIRMGRWIKKNLPQEGTLIANMVPYSTLWGDSVRLSLSYDRGNTCRDTVFSRLSPLHEIRTGNIVDRKPFLAHYRDPIDENIVTLRALGVTHLLVDSRPESNSFVATASKPPIVSFGSTYLFDIR